MALSLRTIIAAVNKLYTPTGMQYWILSVCQYIYLCCNVKYVVRFCWCPGTLCFNYYWYTHSSHNHLANNNYFKLVCWVVAIFVVQSILLFYVCVFVHSCSVGRNTGVWSSENMSLHGSCRMWLLSTLRI